ncbi:autotransporter outer membrane beta-barrel domain-containing protein [Tropicimonas sp. IMCC34043]|uniref:autotransporter outer membrane beta-barrel domain-containing protein n=1 Tax=Tropicimonas sp. IMCC34043 TaxID=2248760 RepID=UPI001300821F|nr:autotransporter outer membrane beta-barrel domain-containing protein [Tropicimonas sp. IMCC34043]
MAAGPTSSSTVGEAITNPVTGDPTTVTALLVDPVGTPTAGDTAFVQTDDGYTFLVKSVGEDFYNSDDPPVQFSVVSISGNTATVTSPEADGNTDFPVGQLTTDFDADFESSGTPGTLTPPVDVTGPNGVNQVVYGQNGSNGRDGALFVPPSSGGDGANGPVQTQTLSTDVSASSNIGWEIGSVGGNGGVGGDSYLSFWSGSDGGNGGAGGQVTATQAATSTITTTGDDNYGIFAYSRSGEAGNGGSGYAAPGGGTGGHSSDGGSVTVNQFGEISTAGTNAHGIYALSVSNNGGNGGNQWGLVGTAGSGGYGGSGGAVDVSTDAGAIILTSGEFANGILAQSIGGTGGSAGNSGNLLVSLIGAADNGGNGGTVTVSNGGRIQTTGNLSRGIMAQSIGGAGGGGGTAGGLVSLALGGVGTNGGSGAAVSVTNTGTGQIATTGLLSDGILAQSIGGSGGQGANAFGLVAVGGNGTKAGSGSTVTVTNLGTISTEGNGARGIVAQSIGGGGGDGGSSGGMVAVGGSGAGGGSGGTVNVTNDGKITTTGADGIGILAQSIGGGGGNGGSSGAVGAFVGVAVGGTGGTGGAGGDANVTLSDTDASQPSRVLTSGDRATGVFVQSVGGGGGNGGGAVSVALGAFGAASVSVGGDAGDGGAGGTVTLSGSGDATVQTGGDDAAGVMLQSVGGGGGNGGYSVAVAASAGPVSGSLAVGVGGSGGSGGAGGEVVVGTVDGGGNLTAPGFSGSILTSGARSTGLLFQSVGGGGGNGGLAVAASGGGSLFFSGSVSVGVGGSGGTGGLGGTVLAYTDSDVVTTGDSSTAMLVQSIGGGGGNGGGSIAAGVDGSGGGAAGISVGVGGSGTTGGAGGDVTLIAGGSVIRTSGQFSNGVSVQSIGGGGGNGGYSVAVSGTGAGIGAGSVNVGVGGSAANGGDGGAVNARIDAAVRTTGVGSGAILVQSVGGGGGNGGFSVAAGAAGGGAGAGTVTVGLGGSGGAGGAGGTVVATVNGDVATKGDRAAGVVAQSIGGGGGNGGFSVSGAVSGAGTGSGAVSVGLGGAGNSGGAGADVTATVTGDVTTEGSDSTGILAESVGGGGGNGGFSVAGTISGSGIGSGAVSVSLGGGSGTGADAGTVTLTSDGTVWTQGDRSSGFVAQSIGGGGGNGGFSVSGAVSGSGEGSGTVAVGLGGSGAGGGTAGDVIATSNGQILTEGYASSGFVAQSIGGGGGNGGFNVSASVAGAGTAAGSVAVGLGGTGGGGGNGATVTADTTANIETRGDASVGVLAQSIGGGGGNGGFNVSPALSGAGTGSGAVSVGLGGSGTGGGNGGTVGLTIANDVLTRGAQSAAVIAQSVGGGGGNGGFNVAVGGTGAGTGSGAIGVGLGGRAGTGGTGGAVSSSVTGNLTTLGETSSALLVQSLGGGGGNGGMNVSAAIAVAGTGAGGASVGIGGAGGNGGDAGTATSVLSGDVTTFGKDSGGVIVQSLGGGGGNGGLNVSAIITAASSGSGGASVGIGGSGGDGGNAGAADSTITGDVVTLGDNAGGVLVQSAGGGGGNGGVNVSAAVNLSSTAGGAAAIGVGGFGGGGGDGDMATSQMTGDIVTTGDNAGGMIVQSLGGGGGNGGLNVSAAVSLTGESSGAVGIGVGGFGGDGGNAAAATGTLAGDVTTSGDNSAGVLVQSLGGGGGNGGLNVSAAVSIAGSGSGAAAIGVGGFGGSGGLAGNVTGTYSGTVVTSGDRAAGVVAQSLGGGGGNGGVNVSAGLSVAPSYSGSVGIGVGGFGGAGGAAGSVTHNVAGSVETAGDDSIGVLSQSLGGGGGNGGTNVAGAVSISRSTSGAVGIGVGGFGGVGADAGGLTTSDFTGNVRTLGDRSLGVVTQSLGGGGGNGGTNVAGAINLTQSNGGSAGLGVGGFGGGGGNGGAVTGTVQTAAASDSIETRGDDSTGVLAQSVGGGGGAGGVNVSGAISLSGKSGAAVALGVGGFGGSGGDGDTVTLDVAGTVSTYGDRSDGILAQSLGGGGGAGGTNVSGTLALTKPSGSDTIFSISAGVGGFGGGGGDAGAVDLSYSGALTALPRTVNGDGSVTLNETEGANGLVAQSIGGGGGDGGVNVSAGVAISSKPGAGQSDTSKSYAVLVGVGGFGGTGGNAAAVNVDVATGSTIRAHGTGKSGILAQSVGGGGGNGGLNVSGGIVSDTSLIVGVGGLGGNAGIGEDVTVTSRADIAVTTDPADFEVPSDESFEAKLREVLGDTVVDAAKDLVDSKGLKNLFVDLGLFKGDEVTETEGSAGLLAQSIGGGGGNGGMNVSGGIALSKDGKIPSITFGIGGFGGSGNVSGDVSADQGGTIAVEGNWKHGILAQSVAGGGGNGGMNVSGQLNWGSSEGTDGATDLSIVAGLGGHGGTGADAGGVAVVSTGNISTEGYHSRGIFAQSVGGGGGTGGMNVTAVATKDSSPVAIGIGGFGAAGGDAGDVAVTRGTRLASAGTIVTDGIGAHGIEASSIGGGGGDAGINAVLGFSKTTGSGSDSGSAGDRKTPTNTGVDDSVIANFNTVLDELEGKFSTTNTDGSKSVNSALIAIGGSAGDAGIGGDVTVTHFGDIATAEDSSNGVFAQSLGGGGGNAVFNLGLIFEAGDAAQNKGVGLAIGGGTGDGGSSGTVTVENTGNIATEGDDSHGIFAQSVGGGGGNAGYTSLNQSGDGGNVGITIGRTGGTGGAGGNVSASSNGQVSTEGDRSHGLFAQSIGNGGGNSSATSVSLATAKTDDDKGNSFSLSVGLEGGEGGAAGNVSADAAGLLYTIGDESHGIFAQSVGGGGGNGGGAGGSAGAATSFSLNIGGDGGAGGISGRVGVASTARIATEGARSDGILAQSIGGAGGTGGIVKGGTSVIAILKNTIKGSAIGTTTSVNIGGTGGDGMTSGDVTVTSGGVVTTKGDNAQGIFAQSVGGGGGKGGLVETDIVNLRSTIATTVTISVGGDGGTGAVSGDVSVTNSSDIGTQGVRSAGVYAQAVGGGGGDAQHVRNLVIGPDADNSSRNALLIGGSGGSGGAAGAVSVTNTSTARIVTDGDESHGIFAQSIGGGGGNGSDVLSVSISRLGSTATMAQGLQLAIGGSGGTGGTGGAIDVINDGLIVTSGDKAHGILAQSIGGGGGNGGYSITGTATLQKGTGSDPTMALNIGGSGGNGTEAGDVTVTNTGEIDVLGDGSYGVLAQSVGGGGGNGGLAVSLSLNDLAEQATNQTFSKIAIGGSGGTGADAGDVTVNHSGPITVLSENGYGIFAQSIGGGGGTAGLSFSTPAATVGDFTVSTGLGARDGAKGTAGNVVVNSTGDIIVIGAGSQAIFSQAVNGGGGTVDTFIDFTKTAETEASASVTSEIVLGGDDVDGSASAEVQQTHTGDIATTEDRSTAMVLQSIGGGGGTASTTLQSGISGDVTLNAMLGSKNTDDATGGTVTATRTGSILTIGDLSEGALVQSIGGGGGRLVVAAGSDDGTSGERVATVLMGSDPSFRNDGGDIAVTLVGSVATIGDNSSAQIIQSIGAGGGETYLTGLDSAEIVMGATDDSTGDGGAVTVVNTGDTSTEGYLSYGFVLHSIGGGGGLVGTDLSADAVDVQLSTANGGDGGTIEFTNDGYVVTRGRDAVAVLAQSLGGGGGSVDGIFRGSSGGAGSGGAVTLDLNGNVMALGEGGIAVMAQSAGRDGAGPIDVSLDGLIVGGSGGTYLADPVEQGVAGLTSGTAAIVIDGGTDNTLKLESGSFLMALNNRILSGGSGNETVRLSGGAVGNIDLGGGTNNVTVTEDGAFYAQDQVDLGTSGLLTIDGDLYLGGTAYLTSGTLGAQTSASDIRVTQDVIQTTAVTGSLGFGSTATYTADVSFGGGDSDLINVSGDATIAGTLVPVLHELGNDKPITLIKAGGAVFDAGTTLVDTPVLSYSLSLDYAQGTIDLDVDADFEMPGMNRNQTNTAAQINRVLSGQGSSDMAPMFALIANMEDEDDVVDAVDQLISEDYAATLADALYASRRFADTIYRCDFYNLAKANDDPRTCYWAMASDSTLTRDASYEYRRYHSDGSAFTAGARIPVGDDLYLGLTAGFENFSVSNGDNFAADGTRTELGVSLQRFAGPLELYGMLNGSTAQYNSNRFIDISGTLPGGDVVTGGTAQAKQRVSVANLRFGAGYRYQVPGNSFYLRPGLDLDATYLQSNNVAESGTDYGLVLDETGQWVLSATPSVEIGSDMKVNATDRLRGFLRGAVAFSDVDDVYIDATFAGASSSDGYFRNYSGISDQTRSLSAGLVLYSSDNSAYMSVAYQGIWDDQLSGQTATVNFGFRF